VAKTVSVIGIDREELSWVRMLLFLLRHPDPVLPELTRQAVMYLIEQRAGVPSAASQSSQSTERYGFERNLVS
jgi:hypothetical protein